MVCPVQKESRVSMESQEEEDPMDLLEFQVKMISYPMINQVDFFTNEEE